MIACLSDQGAFERLRAEGVRSGRGPIRLVFRSDSSQPPRIAFAIPRSVGNAVVRNRVKRRVRAVLRELESSPGPGLAGGDYLVRVTAAVDHWSHPVLRSVVVDLLCPAADRIGAGR